MSLWIEGGLTRLAELGDLAGVEGQLAAGVPVDFVENGRFNATPLQVASAGGHLSVVELLISHGANVNHVDNDLCGPATAAAGAGKWDVLKLLAKHGADLRHCDSTGRSALEYLRRCRSQRIRAEIEGLAG